MEEVKEYATYLIKGLVKNPDIVTVQEFEGDENSYILEIIVDGDDMGTLIGKGGYMAKAVKNLIVAAAYKKGISKIKVNIDSI